VGTIVAVLVIDEVNDAEGDTIGVAVELGIIEATWVGVGETATVFGGGKVLRATGEPVKVAVAGAIFFAVGVAETLAREFPLTASSMLLVNIKKAISVAPTTPRTIQTRAENPGALCIFMGYLPSFSRGMREPIFINPRSRQSPLPIPIRKIQLLVFIRN
jgi:hypothetical protein